MQNNQSFGNPRFARCVICALLALLPYIFATEVIVPAELDLEFPTYRYFYGKHLADGANLQLNSTSYTAGEVCGTEDLPLAQGRIVLVKSGVCHPRSKARRLKAAGAIGLIDVDDFGPGFMVYFADCLGCEDLSDFYMFSTTSSKALSLANNLIEAESLIYEQDIAIRVEYSSNPWQAIVTSGAWIFYQVASALVALFSTEEAARRFYGIGKPKKFKPSIPLFCLFTEAIANTLRLIGYSVDPLGSHRLMGPLGQQIFYTIPLPFTMIATLMLVFFFHELSSGASMNKDASFLAQPSAKVAAALVIFLLFFFNIYATVSAVEFKYPGMYVLYNMGATVIMFLVATSFIYSTWQVRRILVQKSEKNNGKMSQNSQAINRLTINVFISAVLMQLEVLCRLLSIFIVQPNAWFALIWIGTLASNFQSYFRILAFSTSKPEKGADTDGSVVSKRNSTAAASHHSARPNSRASTIATNSRHGAGSVSTPSGAASIKMGNRLAVPLMSAAAPTPRVSAQGSPSQAELTLNIPLPASPVNSGPATAFTAAPLAPLAPLPRLGLPQAPIALPPLFVPQSGVSEPAQV